MNVVTTHKKPRMRPRATFGIVSTALFMVVLDNLVVTTALPSIRADLGATIENLQWTVNAYTLSFAVLLLTGAALGDRFGRKRMFTIGLSAFTVASAAAALAPTTSALIAARAIQGAAAASVLPLTLTLLSEAFPAGRRGLVLGLWSGISGLAVAIGPLVGGAVVDGISWHWIFWINVPIGIALVPLAARFLTESRGPARHLDLPGLALGGFGLLGVVYGIVRGNELGWASTEILASLGVGAALVAAFVAWELRAPHPMLPMRFFRSRAFAAANGVGFFMSFGVFGSIFLLAPFLQVTQGLSPLEAGIRTLPWTAMPMLVAPIAGVLSDRVGSRPLMALGLSLQGGALAWLAAVSTPSVPYSELVLPFIMAGAGMALVFAPSANAVLGSVRQREAGQASGATNAIRELGGVMGVAVLASVFTSHGSYASPQAYTDGMVPAVWVGAAVLAVGALVALTIPRRAGRATAPATPAIEVTGEPVPA
jgi:EmrB/QacA subfamily drug resistance transporter